MFGIILSIIAEVEYNTQKNRYRYLNGQRCYKVFTVKSTLANDDLIVLKLFLGIG
ncbi:hypothetical protein GNIT_3240 [Glaciecola nitratireducens FR1064]|uniref:Uncharacterized protein n=1 Tax=Glaciecola nitratireducens (strain JCM 12485 / KCTC 12276 / FR1064) TaxID=1085623 RepID=G4QE60_GLANF|nr:hypothetical protein GNIT_3240 [Glaciecola nitratireducens FR1064]